MTIVMAGSFILLFPVLSKNARYRLATVWCDSVLNWLRLTCGVRYEIVGLENLPSTPTVFLANHQSSWETILFYKLLYPVSPILKKELMRIPFWGWAMRLQNPIAIDRSKPREAGKSLLIQGVDRLENGISVIVFPEGTRSAAGTIKRFSRGGAKLAVAANTPIVPIVHNAGDCWPPRQFIKRPGFITVTIGPSIAVTDRTASELTVEVEQWIRDQFQQVRT
jgi:1-acyl-sn-glycerol-3-phosphate acyltransferase